MATQCTASPGWYCSPLDGSVTICQESWYCPGGNLPPRSCPDGTWSAIQSSQLSDCQDHMNVSLAIAITVLLVSLAIVLCCWFSYLLEPSSKPAVCYPSNRCAYTPLNPNTPSIPDTYLTQQTAGYMGSRQGRGVHNIARGIIQCTPPHTMRFKSQFNWHHDDGPETFGMHCMHLRISRTLGSILNKKRDKGVGCWGNLATAGSTVSKIAAATTEGANRPYGM